MPILLRKNVCHLGSTETHAMPQTVAFRIHIINSKKIEKMLPARELLEFARSQKGRRDRSNGVKIKKGENSGVEVSLSNFRLYFGPVGSDIALSPYRSIFFVCKIVNYNYVLCWYL